MTNTIIIGQGSSVRAPATSPPTLGLQPGWTHWRCKEALLSSSPGYYITHNTPQHRPYRDTGLLVYTAYICPCATRGKSAVLWWSHHPPHHRRRVIECVMVEIRRCSIHCHPSWEHWEQHQLNSEHRFPNHPTDCLYYAIDILYCAGLRSCLLPHAWRYNCSIIQCQW